MVKQEEFQKKLAEQQRKFQQEEQALTQMKQKKDTFMQMTTDIKPQINEANEIAKQLG